MILKDRINNLVRRELDLSNGRLERMRVEYWETRRPKIIIYGSTICRDGRDIVVQFVGNDAVCLVADMSASEARQLAGLLLTIAADVERERADTCEKCGNEKRDESHRCLPQFECWINDDTDRVVVHARDEYDAVEHFERAVEADIEDDDVVHLKAADGTESEWARGSVFGPANTRLG